MENLATVVNYTHKKFEFKRRFEAEEQVNGLDEPPTKIIKIEPMDEETEPEQKPTIVPVQNETDVKTKNKKLTKILSALKCEQVQNVMKYHANMVRIFPKKERTVEEQKRRDANTMACRVSRRCKRLEAIAVQKERLATEESIKEAQKEFVMATAYFQLISMLDKMSTDAETRSTITPEIKDETRKDQSAPLETTTSSKNDSAPVENAKEIKFSIDYILHRA